MTRQINADQVEVGDVIAWAGRRSTVRTVEHGVTTKGRRPGRTFVHLDLDVPELAHEGKGLSPQQNGLHWWANELVTLWDERDPMDEAYDAAIAVIEKHAMEVPRWLVVLAVNAAFDAQARASL